MVMGSFRLREPGDRDYAKRRRQMTRQINTFTTRAQHNGRLGIFRLMPSSAQGELPRRDIDRQIAPLGCRDLGQTPLHQRLASRDDLHHRGVPRREIRLDGADQAFMAVIR